jgi:hypothetical protein
MFISGVFPSLIQSELIKLKSGYQKTQSFILFSQLFKKLQESLLKIVRSQKP